MDCSNLRRRTIALFSVMLFCVVAFAQKTVTGHVKDAQGDIIGASVLVKGTTNGAATDIRGNFTISGVKNSDVLVVSYMGYATQSVTVGSRNRFEIVLQEDGKLLEEVVAVGYGVMKKSDVTGAMVRVGEKELRAMPVSNAIEGMQGKAAGVDITSSQRPGEIGSINIRGVRSLTASNTPLYVIDGMVMQNADAISAINPADIESIDILKDASATAIYGHRGANGVVLITTKRGQAGKVSLNYSGSVRFDWLDQVGEMMTASEWLDYARLAKYTSGSYKSSIGSDGKVIPVLAQDQGLWGSVESSWKNIAQAYDANGNYDPSKVGSYDWTEAGKQTGLTQDHNINVSGGNEKYNGYASFGYLNTKGVQPGQNYTRYTANVAFDAEPLPYFKMGAKINGSFRDQDYGYSFTKSVTGAGDYYNALAGMLPWTEPYDANGEYVRNPAAGDVNIINPINELNYTTNNRKNYQFNGSFYGQLDFGEMWSPLKGLRYRIQFGPEFRFGEFGQFNNKNGINGDGNNNATWNHHTYRSWTLDNLVYYDRTFGQHKIGVTLGQSASAWHFDYANNSSTGVAMETEMWYNLSSGTFKVGTGYSEQQLTSYLGRINYSFADKYLLTASIRYDGSSVLSPGHKWASFPSASLGWRIDRERFMENQNVVSMLKLRAGVGISGNAAISPYDTKGALQSLYYQWGSNPQLGYVGSDASAKSPNMMANQELGWERTTQWNVGLDYGFLNNRINGNLDVYTTRTKDLLMQMQLPSPTGYTSTMANVGKTKGWGIDFQLNAVAIDTRDFKWNLGLTWSLDRSEIVELANGAQDNKGKAWFVGEELGVYYDYVYDGIWKTDETYTVVDADGVSHDYTAADYNRKTGQIRVKDVDGNGKIDSDDRQIVAKRRPRWSGGLTSSFTYKNWDLSFFIFSRWGFTTPNGALNLDGRYMQRSIDYFVPGYNEDALYYQPGINGESADTYQSSMNYQDGSFVKVRNINLGYTFNKKQLARTGLSSLKIYAQAMNPFSIYRACKYLDTDLMTYDNNSTNFGSMTTVRSFVVGLKVEFDTSAKKKSEPVTPMIVEKEVVKEVVKEVPVLKEVTIDKFLDRTYVVTFQQGSAEIENKAELDGIKAGSTVDVIAYASPEGTVEGNQELSQRRADAVAKYLQSKSVNVSRTVAKGADTQHANRIAIVTVK